MSRRKKTVANPAPEPGKFFSVRGAARMLAMSPRRLNEICQAKRIGTIIEGSGSRILSGGDIDQIAACRRPRGRPRKQPAAAG